MPDTASEAVLKPPEPVQKPLEPALQLQPQGISTAIPNSDQQKDLETKIPRLRLETLKSNITGESLSIDIDGDIEMEDDLLSSQQFDGFSTPAAHGEDTTKHISDLLKAALPVKDNDISNKVKVAKQAAKIKKGAKRVRVEENIDTLLEVTGHITDPNLQRALSMIATKLSELLVEVKQLKEPQSYCRCQTTSKWNPKTPGLTSKELLETDFPHLPAMTTMTELMAGRSNIDLEKKTYAKTAKSGNGRPATKTTHKEMAGKRVVGNRKDTISFAPLEKVPHSEEVTVMDQEVSQRLILPKAPPPKDIQAIAIRIERVQPRNKAPASEWRKQLAKDKITPFSVTFPYRTSLEIVLPKEQEVGMRKFLNKMDRVPENPDPYCRRDGKPGPLSDEIIQKVIEQRLRTMELERSVVGLHHFRKQSRMESRGCQYWSESNIN